MDILRFRPANAQKSGPSPAQIDYGETVVMFKPVVHSVTKPLFTRGVVPFIDKQPRPAAVRGKGIMLTANQFEFTVVIHIQCAE